MKRNVSLLLVIFLFVELYAYHPFVEHFTKEDYRAGNQNWSITQDGHTILYFANNSGLLEFDGKNWNTYFVANKTPVRSISIGDDDKIYCGAFNEFGYFTRQKDGKLHYTSLFGQESGSPADIYEVWHVLQDERHVYFQAEKGILRYEKEKEKVTWLPFHHRIDASAYLHGLYFFSSSEKGAFILDGNLFIHIPGSEILENKKVCSILPLKDRTVLFVTNMHGTYLFDGMSIVPYSTGMDDFLTNNLIFCAQTNERYIAYGTVQRGIAIQDLEDGSQMYLDTHSGLQNNSVLSIFFDNMHNLWLGLDKGIDYVLLNSSAMNLFGDQNNYGSGYASHLKDNVLFLGTNQGVYTCPYPFINATPSAMPVLIPEMQGQVWCLTEIDNTLFCGNDRGAYIIHPDRIEPIKGVMGTWAFKPLRSHPNMILGCSYQGLFILRKINGAWKFSHFIKGNFHENGMMYEEDNDGTIWFSHWQKGIYQLHFNDEMDSISRIVLFDESKGFPTHRNNTVYRIDNSLVFSTEGGFYYYHPDSDMMKPDTSWNSLFITPPTSIRLHESPDKNVWFISGEYTGVIYKSGKEFTHIDSISYQELKKKFILGFESFNFLHDKNILLSTEDGFLLIDQKRDMPTEENFTVYLRSVYVTGKKDSIVSGHIYGNDPEEKEVFQASDNSLRFEFIAPDYRKGNKVEYSYFLENYDTNWSDFQESNSKEYTKLPKGNYVFHIIAQNKYTGGRAESAYYFTILPAWYETNVALGIYLFLLFGLLIGLVEIIKYQSEKKAKQVQKQKEQEMQEQEKRFMADTEEKEKEINMLKREQLEYELRHKSQELASSTMNLIRKNEILLDLQEAIAKVHTNIKSENDLNQTIRTLHQMEENIKENIESDNNWRRFEENFDLVYENFLKKLVRSYPDLTLTDKKICAYLRMGLSSKDIAPLLNISIRSIEMVRYRLRKKLNLSREDNLVEFLQRL